MAGRIIPGIRFSRDRKLAAPQALAAILAALFMVFGTAHAAAHGDEPHVDCVAGSIVFGAAVKLAPASDVDIPAPKSVLRAAASSIVTGALQENRSLPVRSRSPPLQ